MQAMASTMKIILVLVSTLIAPISCATTPDSLLRASLIGQMDRIDDTIKAIRKDVVCTTMEFITGVDVQRDAITSESATILDEKLEVQADRVIATMEKIDELLPPCPSMTTTGARSGMMSGTNNMREGNAVSGEYLKDLMDHDSVAVENE